MLITWIVRLVFHDISENKLYLYNHYTENITNHKISIEMSLAAFFSPGSLNADTKLLKQQLFESLW